MRRRWILGFAGLAALSTASMSAQTVPDPAPPQPQTQSPAQLPSRPAYDPNRERAPATEPAPKPAPPIVILKEQPPTPTPAPDAAPSSKPRYTPDEIFTAYEPYGPYGPPDPRHDTEGSAYIPLDSWVYPEMMRLYGLGYADTEFLALRPWTRRSVLHILLASQNRILSGNSQEAQEILTVLLRELADEQPSGRDDRGLIYGTHTVYTRVTGIGGNSLRDSYHLGQTLINDYGRPYGKGFNSYTGASFLAEYGPFSFHVRGEFQHAAGTLGYTPTLSAYLSRVDAIPFVAPNFPQSTIPTGPIDAQNPLRLMEATLSVHLLGHEFSGGKTDAWIGPSVGGGMSWSNNAENIYSFRINRIEPLSIPFVSRVLGPVRYDFFLGSLKGHTYPNHPWVHSEVLEFAPTSNFQFGFQRTIIFGGAAHEPVTLHTFFKGFFSVSDTTQALKFSRDDPGARFSSFNFSYRLPFLRNLATFYADSDTHDDVLPISAPRRTGWRTGLYLSHLPLIPKLDLRAEAVSTDCSTHICTSGSGQYIETVQRQGYTNKGLLLGDWIGREAKGGQAWLTYHLSGNESFQLAYLNKKTPYDFIAGGTTQNQFTLSGNKRFGADFEVNASVQYERWKAPVYLPGQQSDTTATGQIIWYPRLHKRLSR